MRHPLLQAALVLLLGAGAVIAKAETGGAPGITVQDAWSRPSIGAGRTGVVYLTVTDTGAPDRLLGASTPVAGAAELHGSEMRNGVMTMRGLDALPVAPDRPLVLRPGGEHLMLTGLTRPLAPGDIFPLTLRFAHAGEVPVKVTVRPLGSGSAMGGMEGDDPSMHH